MSTTEATDLALIDAWANEAITQFLKDTKAFVKTASLAVTANSGDYTLDSDILSFVDAWMDPASGESRVLEQIGNADLIRMRNMSGSPQTGAMYFAIQGYNLLRLYPSPASSQDTLHIVYVPRPLSAMSATADAPSGTAFGNIPDEFHPTIEAYVKWKACEAEEHAPSQQGLTFQAMYEDGCKQVRSTVNRRSGVTKGRARVGRGRRFPATPGTDLG